MTIADAFCRLDSASAPAPVASCLLPGARRSPPHSVYSEAEDVEACFHCFKIVVPPRCKKKSSTALCDWPRVRAFGFPGASVERHRHQDYAERLNMARESGACKPATVSLA